MLIVAVDSVEDAFEAIEDNALGTSDVIQVLYSPEFVIQVNPSEDYSDVVESTNEYTALTQQTASALAAATAANTAASSASAAASNIAASVSQTASGATITVTDADGTQRTANITNGADGQDGADGRTFTVDGTTIDGTSDVLSVKNKGINKEKLSEELQFENKLIFGNPYRFKLNSHATPYPRSTEGYTVVSDENRLKITTVEEYSAGAPYCIFSKTLLIPFGVNSRVNFDYSVNNAKLWFEYQFYDEEENVIQYSGSDNRAYRDSYSGSGIITTEDTSVKYLSISGIGFNSSAADASIEVSNLRIEDINDVENIQHSVEKLSAETQIWDKNKCRTIAHMGDPASGVAENSKTAFIAAAKKGYWGIETDVVPTADNDFICCHDLTVDDTSTSTGNVSSYTVAQLKEMTLKIRGTQTTVTDVYQTLDEFLDVCRIYGVVPIIDTKNTDYNYELLVEKIRNHNLERGCIISSFSFSRLWNFRSQSDKVMLLFNVNSSDSISNESISRIKKMGNAGLSIALANSFLTASNIAQCHKDGLMVFGWTVYNATDEAFAKTLRDAGIDGVFVQNGNVDITETETSLTYYNKSQIDSMIGNIDTALTGLVSGGGVS